MIQMYNDRLFGNYLTETFADVYPSFEDFLADSKNNEIGQPLIPAGFTEESLRTLYYLLLAKYANNSIAASDVNRFKLHLFSIIFQHGGTWQKRLDIQNKICSLSDDKIKESGRRVNNHAYNPAYSVSADSVDNLDHIDQQSQNMYVKSQLEAYAEVSALLEEDYTEDFIQRFKVLFLWVVSPQRPLWYETSPADFETITNENM